MSVDPMTGCNPSYCFIDLTTRELAERVMEEYNGADFLRRPLKVKPGVKSGGGSGLGEKLRDPSKLDVNSLQAVTKIVSQSKKTKILVELATPGGTVLMDQRKSMLLLIKVVISMLEDCQDSKIKLKLTRRFEICSRTTMSKSSASQSLLMRARNKSLATTTTSLWTWLLQKRLKLLLLR